jgi:DNA-directed RNA polymerase specialized sigma24 family protein
MEAGTFQRSESASSTQDGWRGSLWKTLRTKAYAILSDETLVMRARAKDHAAFDALVARYRARLFAMALSSLGTEGKAADALYETVYTAFKDIGSFDARRTTSTWLYMHGLRAVFKRMNAPRGRYSFETRPADCAAEGSDD